MNTVRVEWSTPDAEILLAKMARVSNPVNENKNETAGKLIGYLAREQHWSPFEMVCACMYIETERDVSRQLLRHRSFHFQEFSQRYAVARGGVYTTARLQDHKNRQNSLVNEDTELECWWNEQQKLVDGTVSTVYNEALKRGIAKEVARRILPEGQTKTRMYMMGTMRDWYHFCRVRCAPDTQQETREVADMIDAECAKLWPVSWEALRYD